MIFVIFSNLLSILVTDRRNRIFQQENSKIRNSWALCYVDVSKNRLTDCYCQARVQVGPGQVQVGSRLGPVQLHVNSGSFNIKVYLKSLRDLDLELEAIIAMLPTTIKLF